MVGFWGLLPVLNTRIPNKACMENDFEAKISPNMQTAGINDIVGHV